jgi:uncharacterized membrane protein
MPILDSRRVCLLILLCVGLTDLSIALDIPILSQVLGFLFLTILPGFLVVRILRLTEDPLEKVLFGVGLSVSLLMFVALVTNFAYPLVGISDSISLIPLLTAFSVTTVVLSLVAYGTGTLQVQVRAINFKLYTDTILTPPALGAALIFVIGIFAALFIRFYNDSIFSLFSVAAIAMAVVLLITSRRVPERYYPFCIFAIALALLYGSTLTSPNLYGRDIFSELYFADLVKSIGFWNPNFTVPGAALSDYWAMLSVTMLPNVYSTLLHIDNVWVYKLVVPFIFAFVPVGLYKLWRTHLKLSNKSAFLSAFFFMSYYAFVLPEPRQLVAEFFLVLIFLLILSRDLETPKKTAVLILFVGSLAVSHYATSYIFLGYLVVLLIGSALIGANNRQVQRRSALSATFVALAVIITFGWYLFASGGAPYVALANAGTHVANTFSTDLFAPPESNIAAGVGAGVLNLPFSHAVYHYWVIATELLIVIGLAVMTWWRKALRVNTPFLLLSFASFFLMLVAIALPSIAAAMNGDRMFAVALIFLAPYCIFGIEAIVATASSWIHANKDLVLKLTHAALIGVLIPYFLFSYGFIWEVTEHPSNYAFLPSLSQGRVLEYSLCTTATWSYMVPQTPISTQDVYAAKWLSIYSGGSPVYADNIAQPEVQGYGNVPPGSLFFLTPTMANHSLGNAYVYLGAANVQTGNIALRLPDTSSQIQPFLSYPQLTAGSLVYSNGLAEVRYYT